MSHCFSKQQAGALISSCEIKKVMNMEEELCALALSQEEANRTTYNESLRSSGKILAPWVGENYSSIFLSYRRIWNIFISWGLQAVMPLAWHECSFMLVKSGFCCRKSVYLWNVGRTRFFLRNVSITAYRNPAEIKAISAFSSSSKFLVSSAAAIIVVRQKSVIRRDF